eukprot:620182-Hanusia_phi.AAC.1
MRTVDCHIAKLLRVLVHGWSPVPHECRAGRSVVIRVRVRSWRDASCPRGRQMQPLAVGWMGVKLSIAAVSLCSSLVAEIGLLLPENGIVPAPGSRGATLISLATIRLILPRAHRAAGRPKLFRAGRAGRRRRSREARRFNFFLGGVARSTTRRVARFESSTMMARPLFESGTCKKAGKRGGRGGNV